MLMFDVRRRELIALLGGAAAAWPLAARAQQQSAVPVIGWLGTESPEGEDYRVVPFRQGLKEAGYIEGQNLAIEYRFAEGQYDRLPALAADLVRRQVAVIAPGGIAGALAAKAATTTIPIVFQIGDDPVRLGLVASLGRPGGNITGVTSLNVEVGPKQLELLHELVPTASIIALLVNPASPTQAEATTREAQVAARRLGLELHVVHARSERDFDPIFASLVKLRAGGLVIIPDSLFTSRREQLGALAFRHAVPAIAPYRGFAAAGGLMSYGTNITNLFWQVGTYAARILKGEKPADLPVQQPVKLELIINLKTAKALGLDVPLSMLMRVHEVIE
jgi:putative ABC transport system substrate-binding protein